MASVIMEQFGDVARDAFRDYSQIVTGGVLLAVG